ncbi:hypothetical protein CCUS01_01020 [Colletotrichum cuscutae]|uniref:Uncharacterized protein n=1 Tax=Colletotrichum cuscutae TaxID=1209917 RepID=A0AAI9V8H9_9PEZI|nr:hypothetical protein CCUS01_01020 [Colletotrichum cuscutae]
MGGNELVLLQEAREFDAQDAAANADGLFILGDEDAVETSQVHDDAVFALCLPECQVMPTAPEAEWDVLSFQLLDDGHDFSFGPRPDDCERLLGHVRVEEASNFLILLGRFLYTKRLEKFVVRFFSLGASEAICSSVDAVG